MKSIPHYYLALLIWILEIIMFASIILLPVVVWLRDNYDAFKVPFVCAHCKSWRNDYGTSIS